MIRKKLTFLTALLTGALTLSSFAGEKKPLPDNEFPIIMYAVHMDDKTMSQLKEMGVNYVHSYSTGRDNEKSEAKADKLLSLAQKHDLKVMLFMRGRYWAKKDNGNEGIKKIVDKYKDSPALGMWMLADEPKPKIKDKIIAYNEIIQNSGSKAPSTLVIHWIKDWWRYGKGNTCDFLMQDFYPVGDQAFPNAPLNNFTKYISGGKKFDKPIIPVLQIFNFKVFPRESKSRKYNISKCRYPNIQEMRYMIFAPMCMGARGMAFYSFARARQLDRKGKWQKAVLGPTISELSKFANLTAPAQTPNQTIIPNDKKYFAAFWLRKTGNWAVVINSTKTAQKIEVKLPKNIKVKSVTKWGNTSKSLKIDVRNNKLKMSLSPWGTAILKLND